MSDRETLNPNYQPAGPACRPMRCFAWRVRKQYSQIAFTVIFCSGNTPRDAGTMLMGPRSFHWRNMLRQEGVISCTRKGNLPCTYDPLYVVVNIASWQVHFAYHRKVDKISKNTVIKVITSWTPKTMAVRRVAKCWATPMITDVRSCGCTRMLLQFAGGKLADYKPNVRGFRSTIRTS